MKSLLLLVPLIVAPTETITYNEVFMEGTTDYHVQIPQYDGDLEKVTIEFIYDVNYVYRVENMYPYERSTPTIAFTRQSVDIRRDGELYHHLCEVSNSQRWTTPLFSAYDGATDYDGTSGMMHYSNHVTRKTITLTGDRANVFEGNAFTYLNTGPYHISGDVMYMGFSGGISTPWYLQNIDVIVTLEPK